MKHQNETRENFLRANNTDLIKWLNSYGYFPESNILPPCFRGGFFSYRYFHSLKNKKLKNLDIKESVSISTPKGKFHSRVFSIIDPKKYSDIVKVLISHKKSISKYLFPKKTSIYSYSFPIPIDSSFIFGKPQLRSGKNISSYVKGENHLLQEAYKYSHFLQTDIKNFYPSIYTHSISWILHESMGGKNYIRQNTNINNMNLYGNRLDCLLQKSHDNCTNGICIGPAISDFIGEIILGHIDHKVSEEVAKLGIKFVGVRFKDDYRILTHSEYESKIILQKIINELNKIGLSIHEDKTIFSSDLPGAILRPWIISVNHLLEVYFPAKTSMINLNKFRDLYAKVIEINNQHHGRGIFEKMLSELVRKISGVYDLRVYLKEEDIPIFLSILIQIKNMRLQALPQILAIFEIILHSRKILSAKKESIIHEMLLDMFYSEKASDYEMLWISYILKKIGKGHSKINTRLKETSNLFLQSLGKDKQQYFKDFNLFDSNYGSHPMLRDSVKSFGYDILIS